MKKLFNGIMSMLLVAGIFAVGCQEYGIDSQPEAAPALQDDAMESYIMAAEAASAVVFNISSNTPWRIERDAEWVTVTPSMSAVSSLVSEVKVSVTDNVTATPRTATLTILAPDAAFEKTVTIYQASKGEILVTESTTDIDAEGGDVEFRIYTNKAWEYLPISNELVDAASLEGAAAGTVSAADVDDVLTYVLHIAVPANTGVKRTLAFMIKTATGNIERTINQKGVTLELGQEEEPVFESSAVGTEMTFQVKANVTGWKAAVADEDAEWLGIASYDNNSVTVKVLSDNNPYLMKRKGTIILTYEDATGVINVYQPSKFTRGAVQGVENEDMSLTANFGAVGQYVFTSQEGHNKGTWTIEFDPERAAMNVAHLYFVLSADGTFTGPCYRCALTSHAYTGTTFPAGVYNSFMQHNNGGWTPNNRWNFDGVKVNGTPTQTDPQLMLPAEAVKKLEKVEFKLAEDGLYTTIYAAGGVYSGELVFTDGKDAYDAMQFKLSMSTVNDAACGGHSTFAGESVTITKVYFTPSK